MPSVPKPFALKPASPTRNRTRRFFRGCSIEWLFRITSTDQS